MPALTRAEARDVIRRKLKKLTSRQEYTLMGTGDNRVGDPASTHPFPDNDEINGELDLATDYINRKCRLGHAQDVTVGVSAQTADGPLAIPLRSVGLDNGLNLGDVNLVKRAYYDDGTTVFRLNPFSRETHDARRTIEIQNRDVGTPTEIWIEAYTLFIYPSPSTAGTLHLIAGTGIAFVGDAASLEVLPTDYHDCLWTCAAWFLARNDPNDAEMIVLSQQYAQLTADGAADILQWKRDVNAQQEEIVVPESDRVTSRRANRLVTANTRPYLVDWQE
jgi:hypothetical protein